MQGGDSLSEDGSGDVIWSAREQAAHELKMAQERNRRCELEIELARSHGSVGLRAAFGERVEAKLVELPLTLKQGQPVFADVTQATPVLCAVTDRLSVCDCLLSANDWTALQQSQEEYRKAVRRDSSPAPDRSAREGRGVR
ncbi:hypothetical protein MTO96_043736 [Rhipicephalus appendiculatus]